MWKQWRFFRLILTMFTRKKTMPYMTNGKRDYAKEDRLYNDKPEIIRKPIGEQR